MKKFIAFFLVLACVLCFSGCSNTKHAEQEEVLTYSFHGEHEYFTISNGSIVLSDTEEVFEGGHLEITQYDIFDEVVSYSTTFYTLTNGKQNYILSNSVIDQTGGTIHISGDLGRVAGDPVTIGDKTEKIDEFKENLWFELKTMDLNGKENVYQIQLTLIDQSVSV